MKNITKLLSCLGVLVLSLQTSAFCDFAPAPGKVPVIVLQGEVTIDGQQRPDLGRSFADTLTGGLLKTKSYNVIDHLSNQPLAQAIENTPTLAPEQSAVETGKATGARWIYVPRMVVEGDFHKLTMKRIRVADGQVVDVFEAHRTGDRKSMFLLIGDSLRHLYRQAARQPTRVAALPPGEMVEGIDLEPANPGIPEFNADPEPAGIVAPPAPVDPQPVRPAVKVEKKKGIEVGRPAVADVVAANLKAIPKNLRLEAGVELDKSVIRGGPGPQGQVAAKKEIKDPATETERSIARLTGTISTINADWRFCVLKLRSKVRVGDRLSVKSGKIVPTDTILTVTKIEGNQAIADIAEDADLDQVKVGQTIYRWTRRK